MGATLTAIQAGGGIGVNWVLLVEGCEIAVTDTSPTAITTLFATDATLDWTDAVGGLFVLGGWEQELEPWVPGMIVGRLTFAVTKDKRASTGVESDVFAELVFGNGNGGETYLDASLDCNDTTVTVKSTAACVGAATSGTVHIGTEAIAFTGVTATTFTGCVRGKYAPFKANTETNQRFGQMHRIPSVGDGVIIKPKVTSKQREWRGRRVGLFAVSNTSTAWSDAHCVWAGRIENIRDGTNGCCYLECADIKIQLRECELMRHQFRGRMQEGVYLRAGWRFEALDDEAGTVLTANDLVVSASPSGSEIQSGRYSIDELMSALNEWLSDEHAATRLNHKYMFGVNDGPQGPRTTIELSGGSSTALNRSRLAMPSLVSDFLGFTAAGYGPDTFGWAPGNVGIAVDWDEQSSTTVVSPEEPYRHILTPYEPYQLDLEDTSGTRFDNRTFLPDLGVTLDSGSEWAVLRFGSDGPMALFELVSETDTEAVFSGGTSTSRLDEIAGVKWTTRPGAARNDRVRYSEALDLEVKQVALIGGRQYKVLTWLVASTGTPAYNSAVYDVLPQQLGAGVPWELLGTNWTSSFQAIDSGQAFRDTYLIDKPMRLTTVIGPSLVARVAQIIWKNEGLRVVSWGTPTAARALHAFTENNKRIAADATDAQRVAANQTDEYLVNRVRVNYGRGEWSGSLTIIDPASQDTHGQFGQTIDLPSINAFGNVSDMADDLKALLPIFSRPLHIITGRTVDLSFYELCAPGDFCTITDNFARDPSTGTRGLSSKAGLITRVAIDWGGFDDAGDDPRPMHGEVDILLLPLSNIAAYSACAEVDNGAANAGYDVATQTLTLKANEHTETSDGTDIEYLCSDADAGVTVIEIDPADPTTPLVWQGNSVDSFNVGANTITLVDPLTGWDNTKRYRVIPNYYNAGVTSEQKTHVFQADDADGMVVDMVGAYVYGTDLTQAGTWTDDDGTEQVALYAEVGYGDGAPLDVGYEKELARLANNLVNYRTAVVLPSLTRSTISATVTVKRVIAVLPINLHPGALMLGDRSLYVRPWYRSNDGTSVTLSVSLCSKPPIGSSFETGDADAPQYTLGGDCETKTWTTTSTSWTAGSAQAFSGRIADSVTGMAYLVLESNSTKLETRGLAEAWQGNFLES